MKEDRPLFRYYRTLGLSPDASAKKIREAYYRLAFKHHPDRNPGDTYAAARFKKIQIAYEKLSNSKVPTNLEAPEQYPFFTREEARTGIPWLWVALLAVMVIMRVSPLASLGEKDPDLTSTSSLSSRETELSSEGFHRPQRQDHSQSPPVGQGEQDSTPGRQLTASDPLAVLNDSGAPEGSIASPRSLMEDTSSTDSKSSDLLKTELPDSDAPPRRRTSSQVGSEALVEQTGAQGTEPLSTLDSFELASFWESSPLRPHTTSSTSNWDGPSGVLSFQGTEMTESTWFRQEAPLPPSTETQNAPLKKLQSNSDLGHVPHSKKRKSDHQQSLSISAFSDYPENVTSPTPDRKWKSGLNNLEYVRSSSAPPGDVLSGSTNQQRKTLREWRSRGGERALLSKNGLPLIPSKNILPREEAAAAGNWDAQSFANAASFYAWDGVPGNGLQPGTKTSSGNWTMHAMSRTNGYAKPSSNVGHRATLGSIYTPHSSAKAYSWSSWKPGYINSTRPTGHSKNRSPIHRFSLPSQ